MIDREKEERYRIMEARIGDWKIPSDDSLYMEIFFIFFNIRKVSNYSLNINV